MYGTTAFGRTSGVGVVFELTKSQAPGGWTETILYNFAGGNDGSQPWAGLIFDSAGNLYGTTLLGGISNAGTVYQLTPGQGGAWTETLLYSFASATDGSGPQSDLIFDRSGNLYGTTTGGGSPGNGIVFELTEGQGPLWTETVSHSFMASEATSPRAAVIFGTLTANSTEPSLTTARPARVEFSGSIRRRQRVVHGLSRPCIRSVEARNEGCLGGKDTRGREAELND